MIYSIDLTTLSIFFLSFKKFKTLTISNKPNISNWKLLNSELLNCKLIKFTVKKIKFNNLFLQDLLLSNLIKKNDSDSLRSKLKHMQVVNEINLNIKSTGFKKYVCLSLTSSNTSNLIENKILYPNDELKEDFQFLNSSQTMVLEPEVLVNLNGITDSKCLGVMDSIEREGSEHVIKGLVDSTIGSYKDYIINHIHSCSDKMCNECFNISKSPEGKFLIELFRTNIYFFY